MQLISEKKRIDLYILPVDYLKPEVDYHLSESSPVVSIIPCPCATTDLFLTVLAGQSHLLVDNELSDQGVTGKSDSNTNDDS